MSVSRRVLPYGSWPTPVTSELVVRKAIRLSEVRVDDEDVIWSEGRPQEGGRTTLMRRSPDGAVAELLAKEQNARTAVHEYGGGAWWVAGGIVWFVLWSDQRLYRLDPRTATSQPLTPEPALPRGDRYADGELTPDGEKIVCVREHHPPDGRGAEDVRNELVWLDAHRPSTPEVLVSGPDFVSSPRVSPNGERLCWIEWDHPNMPWDGTRLRIRQLRDGEERTVAGGPRESVLEPQWQRDGTLTFISDRTGWWNLYGWAPGQDEVEALVQIEAEIGEPHWVFASSRYAVLGDRTIVFARWRGGFDGLAVRRPDGSMVELDLPFSRVRCLRAAGEMSVVAVTSTPTEEAAVARIELGGDGRVQEIETLRAPRQLSSLGLERGHISVPEPVEFVSAGGRTAHALLYRPANPRCVGPEHELPPMLVEIHGGPTSAASPALELDVQYWTSRGFAFLDLNYGGSTGYGRAYRELLRGNWGVVDVEDAIAAACWAAAAGHADPARICIRGGSAGGYTTLAALAREDTPFAAGADWFGVADLELFIGDTHKFESRYLDSLVGPYPQQRERYRQRSPINHIDRFSRPLIVLQGLEDAVVPPEQATIIVEALRAKRIPVVYVAFEGEQHGFRQATNIRRALDSELSFYAAILGFELPEEEGLEPVAID